MFCKFCGAKVAGYIEAGNTQFAEGNDYASNTWEKEQDYDDEYSEPEPVRSGPSQYSEKDFLIKTMRAEGVAPEYAEDHVFQAYISRFIKGGMCTRCGGKLNFLKKCKSCGASLVGGTL